MNEKTNRQPTCAERVQPAFESRIAWLGDLLAAYNGEKRRCGACEGTGSITWTDYTRCLRCDGKGNKLRYDEDGYLLADTEHACEGEHIHEAGLAFDFVESDGEYNDGEPYFRFQISYGGPSEKFRFYVGYGATDFHRAEFWFLDWFDGAGHECSSHETVRELWRYLSLDGDSEHLARVANA